MSDVLSEITARAERAIRPTATEWFAAMRELAALRAKVSRLTASLAVATAQAEAARRDLLAFQLVVLEEVKELRGWAQLSSVRQSCKRLEDAAARASRPTEETPK